MVRDPKRKSRKPAQRVALEATPPVSEPSMPSVSKAEAVRRAVAAGKGGPAEGVAYVLEQFGIEIDNKTFSLNKSQQKAREAKKDGLRETAPRGETGRTVRAILAPPALTPADGDLIDVMEKMKPLVAQHGAEQLKRLVDLLD